MLARAIALASLLGEDAAPLERLPDPLRAPAHDARARFDGLPRGARSAAVARETVALFALPAPAMARRVLPRGLVTALAPAAAPAAASAPAEPGSWLARALRHAPALGLRALARASVSDPDGATPAAAVEVLRRLGPQEAAGLVAARRAPASRDDVERSRLVLALAVAEDGQGSLTRRMGLCRIGWAASVEAGAVATLDASVAAEDRPLVARAAQVLWFTAGERAAAERERIVADLEASA